MSALGRWRAWRLLGRPITRTLELESVACSAATVLRRVVRACTLRSLLPPCTWHQDCADICNTQCFFSDFKLRHLCWIVVEEDAGRGT